MTHRAEFPGFDVPNPVPILRGFRWMATSLETFRSRPLPGQYLPLIQPTFDTFGTEIFGQEIGFESVQSGLGDLELLHTRIPRDRIRQYISLEWFHDDSIGAPRRLQLIRVLETAGGFPQIAIRPDRVMAGGSGNPALQEREGTQMVVGMPNQWVGVRAGDMGVGARMTLRVMWVDMPVGEYMIGFANR